MIAVNARMLIGLFVIAIGATMLLGRLGYEVNAGQVWLYWPAIPLVIGLNSLVQVFRGKVDGEPGKIMPWGQLLTAIILIMVGILFLGRNLGYWDREIIGQFMAVLVPLLIIFAGLSLLRGKPFSGVGGSRTAILGGIEEGKSPWELKSGSYMALLGGIDLDLTTATIPEGETVLDLTAVLGGIDVKVPRGLPVVLVSSAVLGGVEFLDQEDAGVVAGRTVERNVDGSDPRLLRIQARAVLGGIDIKEK